MANTLLYTPEAHANLDELEGDASLRRQCKAVQSALGKMENDLRYPGLNTHEHTEMSRRHGKKIFEAYAQNKTPGAWRIFFHHGPGQGVLAIVAITPHP